jgi:hypothetical protein
MQKKGHSKKHRMTRRKHRGGFYGAKGAIAPGAMEWGRGSEMGSWAVSSRGGNTMYGSGRGRSIKKTRKYRGGMGFCQPDMSAPDATTGKCKDGSDPMTYAGRRRQPKKTSSKRTRKHRGGGSYGGVSASFQGSGSRGIADYKPIVTRDGSGAAAGGAFNNFGAQPGSGFSSFVKAA